MNSTYGEVTIYPFRQVGVCRRFCSIDVIVVRLCVLRLGLADSLFTLSIIDTTPISARLGRQKGHAVLKPSYVTTNQLTVSQISS